MNNKNLLISGAGIAGTALAFWLKKFGFNPTIVEKAPKLHEGGYATDFWGAGYEVTDRMEVSAKQTAIYSIEKNKTTTNFFIFTSPQKISYPIMIFQLNNKFYEKNLWTSGGCVQH